ncbi:MAG: [FeFe] hydrogenase H-cluster radical SAM maturase HydE [Candidatus Delongbacteria bacterium]|jgi:biotin synthase|nr:[FeFe] hydrogenase H-cluster radical SAM maturase HydE [Candidatus Delongbacteria bacterium]
MNKYESLLNKNDFTREEIIALLSPTTKDDHELLLEKAGMVRNETIGNNVYFRGLIEYSNICAKNCYYCGIRRGNEKQGRYTMTDQEVLDCAKFAYDEGYGSLVIQAGEVSSKDFTDKIEYLLKEIKKLSNGKLGITLSLGEQTSDVLKKWFEAGGHRYLIRIETSNKDLYARYHPNDELHSYDERLRALNRVKDNGFQTGTGVMIGLPRQNVGHLADDLLFIKKFDVDMVGMGPYIESDDTPMYEDRNILISKKDRFELSLRMVAVLRLMMPDINIAATTAMQTLDPVGREKAIKAGANVIMPNLTPVKYRESYLLYEGKPCLDEEAEKCKGCIMARIKSTGTVVALNEWGDSNHFFKRKNSDK